MLCLMKVTQNQPLPKPAKPAHRVTSKRTAENPANNPTHSSKPWPVLTRAMTALKEIAEYIRYYNFQRKHSAIEYLTPAQFEQLTQRSK